MSHLQIPFISELDKHYSPRTSMEESRRASVASGRSSASKASRLQLPLITALDQHYSPRPSMETSRRPSAAAKQTPSASRSQLRLPLISDLDDFYSPRPSMDSRRPSVPSHLPNAPVTEKATKKAAKKSDFDFMDAIQRYPWFSGSH